MKTNPIYLKETDMFIHTCNESIAGLDMRSKSDLTVPIVYFVTPTYHRREQVVELIRLSQTLVNVKNLVWIIAEDSEICSSRVSSFLFDKREKIPYIHLISPIPKMYDNVFSKPKGVSSRNAAVNWIIDKEMTLPSGIIYFGDDDNTYDLRLFEEIRMTRKVSMFPVGFIGTIGFSSPIIEKSKVIGFTDYFFANRKFPVDMAGFAVNIDVLRRHKPKMPFLVNHEETLFLQNLNLNMEDIEPLANDCTEVLVWHTKTVKNDFPSYRIGVGSGTNLHRLMKSMSDKGLASESTNGDLLPVCMNSGGFYW